MWCKEDTFIVLSSTAFHSFIHSFIHLRVINTSGIERCSGGEAVTSNNVWYAWGVSYVWALIDYLSIIFYVFIYLYISWKLYFQNLRERKKQGPRFLPSKDILFSCIVSTQINSVLLARVVHEILRMQADKTSHLERVRQGVKACVVLFPLLGLTWVFGVLSVTDAGLVFQYIFTVFNSLQVIENSTY